MAQVRFNLETGAVENRIDRMSHFRCGSPPTACLPPLPYRALLYVHLAHQKFYLLIDISRDIIVASPACIWHMIG